jgi:hypothetical protein
MQLEADLRKAVHDELRSFREELLRDIADVVASVAREESKEPDSR